MKLSKIRPISFLSKVINNNLRLDLSETPKYVTTIKEDYIYKNVNNLNRWYIRIIGLDEVRACQDRVVNLQEKLLAAQEQRREIGSSLTELRKKSNELQDQIHKVKRQDDLQRFLDLMKEETEILKQENEVTRRFSDCDQAEREIFAAFTNAIRDSHEKQRAQLEYTKYFGLVLSITGSFLAFIYSTLKKQDLKQFIEKNIEKIAADTASASTMVSVSGLPANVVKDLAENKKHLKEMVQYINNENRMVMDIIRQNHREVKELIWKHSFSNDLRTVVSEPTQDVTELFPSVNKIVWYSVASLFGIVVLRSILG